MNFWLLFLLILVISLALNYFIVKLGYNTRKLVGTPFIWVVLAVLLGGLVYYLVWEKSVYVEIKVDDQVLYKSKVKYESKHWNDDRTFRYSSVTRGIDEIDYRALVNELLAEDTITLCQEYQSQAKGTGRYKHEAGAVTVCVNKKGVRWFF